jgi:ABC-type antimicrobial peptide transport system permease subunit
MTDADFAGSGRVVVINENAANQLFPGEPPLGQQLTRPRELEPWTVIGVVANLRHQGPLNVRDAEAAQVFFPQNVFRPAQPMVVVVQSSARTSDLAVQLRQTAQSVGPPVLVERIRTADDWFNERVITPRRRTVLLGLMGAFGLTLSAVGIFGITAYVVTRRTSEVGLRMAFGALPGQVVRLILRDAVQPVMLGLVVGLLGAYYASRVVETFLFETTPHDPLTFVGVSAVVVLNAVFAAWIPARRAAKVDPVVALRVE